MQLHLQWLNTDQNATGRCAAQVLGFIDIIMQPKCQWRWLSARRGMPLCLPQKQWWAARLCAELEHSEGVSSLWYLIWWLGSTCAASKLAFNYMKLSNICRKPESGSAGGASSCLFESLTKIDMYESDGGSLMESAEQRKQTLKWEVAKLFHLMT